MKREITLNFCLSMIEQQVPLLNEKKKKNIGMEFLRYWKID